MLRQRSGAAVALWRIHRGRDPSAARQHRHSSSLPQSVIYEDDQHGIRDSSIPKPVWDCLHQLRVAGHEVFLVGGAVRDLLLHIQEPKDFDLLTSAQLQKVKELFQHHKPRIVGRNFPICQLEVRGHKVEVSSMHTRPPAKPWSAAAAPVNVPADVAEHLLGSTTAPGRGRRSSVLPHMAHQQQQPLSWATAKRANAAARDFTANALLYDPFQRVLYDYVGGVPDLHARQLRCVGDAAVRFQADPACLLRAVRCAARAGLSIEPGTASALQGQGHLVTSLNNQRITAELMAMMAYGAAAPSLLLLQQTQLMQHVLPVHYQHLQRWRQQQQKQQGSGPDRRIVSAISEHARELEDKMEAQGEAEIGQLSADSALGQLLRGSAAEQQGRQQQQQQQMVLVQQSAKQTSTRSGQAVAGAMHRSCYLQQTSRQSQTLLMLVAAALDQQVTVREPASAEVVLACLTAPMVVEVMQHAVQQVQQHLQQHQQAQAHQEQQAMPFAVGVLDPATTPQPAMDRSSGISRSSSSSSNEAWTIHADIGPGSAVLQHPLPAVTATAAVTAARAYSTSRVSGEAAVTELWPVSQQLLSGACVEAVIHEQAVALATQVCAMSNKPDAGSSSAGQLFGIHTPQLAAGLIAAHVNVCKHLRLLRAAHAHTAAAKAGRSATRQVQTAGREQHQRQTCGTRHQQQHLIRINSSSGKGMRSVSSSVQCLQQQYQDCMDYEQLYPRTNKQYRRLMEQQRQAAVQCSRAGDLEIMPSNKALLTAAAEAVFGERSLDGIDKEQPCSRQQHKQTASLVAGVALDHQEHLVHQVLVAACAGFDQLEHAVSELV